MKYVPYKLEFSAVVVGIRIYTSILIKIMQNADTKYIYLYVIIYYPYRQTTTTTIKEIEELCL